VFAYLALVEHYPDAFDVHHQTICKFDIPSRPAINAGEHRSGPRHVIQGSNIQHPPTGRLLSTIIERGVDLLFNDVDYLLDAAGLGNDLLLRCSGCRSPLHHVTITRMHDDWICDQPCDTRTQNNISA
jgi:hypothetical protein